MMAQPVPLRPLRLQYVPVPDQQQRLRQVFALLAQFPLPPTHPHPTSGQSNAVSAPGTTLQPEEGGIDNGRCPLCPCLEHGAQP